MPRRRIAPHLLRLLLALAPVGCKENLSPAPPGGIGPDAEGPLLILRPGQDTTVDSTGILNVRVLAADRSLITLINLVIVGGSFGFQPVAPNDTVATIIYPIALTPLAGSTFQVYARGRDILNHETVSDTVTVTVR